MPKFQLNKFLMLNLLFLEFILNIFLYFSIQIKEYLIFFLILKVSNNIKLVF